MNLILTSADDEAVVTDAYQDNLHLEILKIYLLFFRQTVLQFFEDYGLFCADGMHSKKLSLRISKIR